MERYLTILEVSRKQDYIFASKELRKNVARSAEIAKVTSSDFLKEAAGEALYREDENMVYTGGGHTVLQFASKEQAKAFAGRVTEMALRTWRDMELYVKTRCYDPGRTPEENLSALTEALEQKKARRKASFRTASFGVEKMNGVRPVSRHRDEETANARSFFPDPPANWEYTNFSDNSVGEGNFLAVVHIDGNAMGARVDHLYRDDSKMLDWEHCREQLRNFSRSIDDDFKAAFSEMAERLAAHISRLENRTEGKTVLPLRPVILAGDDVCFVTAGKLGLECARIFMERLARRSNKVDGHPYASCAGVALVHKKFPFSQAYALAEELCSNAKHFGTELDEERRVSMIDWHIEFGQLKDSLGELRRDYATEDSTSEQERRLELRPLLVTAPKEVPVPPDKTGGVRTYAYFKALCANLREQNGNIARGKIKELRTALRQGELESRFFLEEKQIQELLYLHFPALYRSAEERAEQFSHMINEGLIDPKKSAFTKIGDVSRCLYFDGIEMIDHFEEIKEEGQ